MPDLDELLTLRPEDDIPNDARLSVTAAELRAFCDAVDLLKHDAELLANWASS